MSNKDLFKHYKETVLRELGILPGFIIGRQNLRDNNDIKYTYDTALMTNTERKQQELLE